MFPRQLDEEGVYSGRILKQGEEFGRVGSFFRHERATTYHLHFDAQVPTKYGWVFVNPYMTLVAAYERLIRGRGQEIKEEISPDIPTEALPMQPPSPGPLGGPPGVAAKPTETATESVPGQKID